MATGAFLGKRTMRALYLAHLQQMAMAGNWYPKAGYCKRAQDNGCRFCGRRLHFAIAQNAVSCGAG